MKALIQTLALTLALSLGFSVVGFSNAQASSSEDMKYAAAVGAQAIARTVVEKRLVGSRARAVLRLALESGKASLGDMTCDRATGKDLCSMYVSTPDDETTEEAEETLYQLNVRIYEGKVVSASFELIAG